MIPFACPKVRFDKCLTVSRPLKMYELKALQRLRTHYERCRPCQRASNRSTACHSGRNLIADISRYLSKDGRKVFSENDVRKNEVIQVEIPPQWDWVHRFIQRQKDKVKTADRPQARRSVSPNRASITAKPEGKSESKAAIKVRTVEYCSMTQYHQLLLPTDAARSQQVEKAWYHQYWQYYFRTRVDNGLKNRAGYVIVHHR